MRRKSNQLVSNLLWLRSYSWIFKDNIINIFNLLRIWFTCIFMILKILWILLLTINMTSDAMIYHHQYFYKFQWNNFSKNHTDNWNCISRGFHKGLNSNWYLLYFSKSLGYNLLAYSVLRIKIKTVPILQHNISKLSIYFLTTIIQWQLSGKVKTSHL